ncbi:MAG TPA: pilin [Candidatus Saccharimonadales bacterium]|nr:pilin [Candidatus Saccharimonadales bacterium]
MHDFLIHFAQNLNVPLPGTAAGTAQIRTIVNVLLSVSGAVALLVITMAGFRYITSRGNPSQTAQARDAILYSLIGLVVIMSAFVIVNFVVFKLK